MSKIRYEIVRCNCPHPVESPSSSRKCPNCNQVIGSREIVCRFCGQRLTCSACGKKARPEQVNKQEES